jgi:hypothetical protein
VSNPYIDPTMKFPYLVTLSALVLSLYGQGAFAQSQGAQDFHAKVIAAYSFQPHTLKGDELSAKSAQLDAFWSYAKANPNQVLPLLRAELADQSNPGFFFYDGAKLLLSLSKDKADHALALASLPKADLQDIQSTDYLTTIHWFASNGFDTREAAFRILAYPEFKADIPKHAITLGQDYSLICMLFPIQDIPFEQDLVHRLDTERDLRSQKSLLLALWYTVTPAGMAAIKDFSARPGVDPAVAEYARQLMAREPGLGFSLSSAASLRRQRAEVMQRPISDEALIDFERLTKKILAKQ